MKRVYVDLDDALRLVTSQAKQNLQWIEDNGKLDAFYNLVDEMFNDNVRLSEIDDYLKYEMETICDSLGIKPSWEDEEVFEESLSITKVNKLLEEALGKYQVVATVVKTETKTDVSYAQKLASIKSSFKIAHENASNLFRFHLITIYK